MDGIGLCVEVATMVAMEELRELEPQSLIPAYRRGRLGFGRQKVHSGRRIPSGPLPSVQRLARELCALRGFDIQTHGALPAGGTLVSVDELNFDRAVVLLSLFSDARIYSSDVLDAPADQVQALSLRAVGETANAPTLTSMVRDLANGRVVILDAAHRHELCASRVLASPILRMHVEIAGAPVIHVLSES